jgi:hypothetical protein
MCHFRPNVLCFCILLILQALHSFHLSTGLGRRNAALVLRDKITSVETKLRVERADVMLIASASDLKYEDIALLGKLLPALGNVSQVSILSRQALIQAVDSTPFCLAAGWLYPSNYCVTIRGLHSDGAAGSSIGGINGVRETLSKWMKQLSSSTSNAEERKSLHVVFATRDVCIKLDY